MAVTMLMYGRTGSGKTTQLGMMIEHVYKTMKKKSRICTADQGGYDTIRPYEELGLAEIIPLNDTDPWVWAHKVSTGHSRDKDGKWVLDQAKLGELGFVAFESAQAIAAGFKEDMEQNNLGGDTASSFEKRSDGEALKIQTTKGFQKFAVPQSRILRTMYNSFKLPVDYVMWTAGASKDDDDLGNNKIVGPDVLGKALTGVLPQIFNYTFRIDVIPASVGKAPSHVLYLGTHQDLNAGNATALGNIRRPLDALPLPKLTIEPANIVQALAMVRDEAQKQAQDAIRKRLGL